MGQGQAESLETALAKTEADAELAIKAAARVVGCLKRLRSAARDGKLRDLENARQLADQVLQTLSQELSNTVEGWQLDEVQYMNNGYADELLGAARRADLQMSLQDGLVYCYPALVRVLPGERAVSIDKVRERRVRPSVLVEVLRRVQQQPARFKPGDFLESLYRAYAVAVSQQQGRVLGEAVIPLMGLYTLLTMLPGQEREYSRQEFARDVYLLDQSGVTQAKDGATIEFHASTGTKGGRTLSVVTQSGADKKYYAICFSKP
ncbi:MAG TPA: hypothetical protein VMW62_13385 [Chloroflexota bacterium]|nr:hypothetical protein [Chloroflexota bacterium]